MTDILFLSDENSNIYSYLNILISKLFYELTLIIILPELSSPWYSQPEYFAKLVKANSSGEGVLYTNFPVYDFSTIIEWHKASRTRTSLNN